MTTVNYINLSLEIWGCILSAIVAVCLLLSKHKKDSSTRIYFAMLFFNIGALFFDAAAFFFRGRMDIVSWWGVRLSNFIAFSCNYLLLAMFAYYLTDFLGKRVKVSYRPMQIIWGLCIFSFIMIIATQFFPIIYSVDANNIYHREKLFWLSHAIGIIGMLISAGILLRYRHVIEPQEKIGLWSYILLPIVALFIQMFVYGIVLSVLASTISLVIIFLFLQAEQGRRLAEQENQLTQDRISIMLSQIQPHFLYNSLNSIRYLCKADPDLAQKAVEDFSAYLRGNMDAIKRQTPIPFDNELEHVRIYLSLEKMRFDDELQIVYDLQTTGFLLPALTVQPLVENAVKYGISKKEGGGTVTIATIETVENFIITISDNGVGYDPMKVQDDGRTHIGIDNVRERLAAICHGNLHIQSTQGIGTTATITISKEETP